MGWFDLLKLRLYLIQNILDALITVGKDFFLHGGNDGINELLCVGGISEILGLRDHGLYGLEFGVDFKVAS